MGLLFVSYLQVVLICNLSCNRHVDPCPARHIDSGTEAQSDNLFRRYCCFATAVDPKWGRALERLGGSNFHGQRKLVTVQFHNKTQEMPIVLCPDPD